MNFNSLSFAIFMPIVFILYWILPHKYRWVLLLISSYYFYMSWNVKYVFIIFFTTLITYLTAICIEKTSDKKRKKIYLLISLFICLGCLFIFKYFNFLFESITTIFSKFSINMHAITLSLILPVGISFFTFQTLGYVIDVYKGKVKAERNFGIYATFISFFPQLVAGPIERTSNLLPQINSKKKFNYEKATYGIKLMAWGFFKKMVVADTVAIYVNNVYNSIQNYQGFALVIATVLFAIQIYCDFSGYSDIAIGTAKMLGIDLMQNFKSPYFSSSIKEFWSRWHISLSTWFKDYVYIPLGGNRVKKWRHCFNLFVTFLISGLWHGASWTFVIWGCIHGILQVFEVLLKKKKQIQEKHNLKWILKVFIVFAICCVAWVFFRANTIKDAIYLFTHVLEGIRTPLGYIKAGFSIMGIDIKILLKMIFVIGILTIYDFISLKKDVIQLISKKPLLIRWTIYVFIVLIVIYMTPINNSSEFIYFQF